MTDFVNLAWRIRNISGHIADSARPAADWLTDRTSDGYATTTRGSESSGGDPTHSPTLAAIADTRTITVKGARVDLRDARTAISQHLDAALNHLEAAWRFIDAVPREAHGEHARTIDHELRHSRCEGWGERHAICDDLDVRRTVVDGSYMRFCMRCYKAMWAATTDAGERGRVTRT